VGARRGVVLSSTNGAGTSRFILSGPGTGALIPDGAGGFSLTLTGTTAASNVIILAPPGGVMLDAITADAPVGLLVGRAASVNGNVTLPGGARTVLLANVSNASMTFAGATPMVLSLRDVTDSSIVSNGPLNALLVNSWTNTGNPRSIAAPSIRVLLDKGNFAGDIAAQSITTAIIKGDLTGDILAGAAFGPDNEPGGGDDTFAAGSIGTLFVSGSVNSSLIAAGLNVIDDAFPLSDNDSLIAGSSIRNVVVSGTLSDDSRVLAATLPARARLGNTSVVTASDPRFVL
ncbi:MAG TPA: hypothetical protein VLI90_15420, partial [Tepidisphaeraceae bacterium]|nr:hypothetical protein [Tepidisphaeraceae bacterium]